MNCREFHAYVVDNWPLKDPLPEGAAADHVRACGNCAKLLSVLEAAPDLRIETITQAESAALWTSITDFVDRAVPGKQRPPVRLSRFLPAAALIILAVAVGAFFYFHGAPAPPETNPPEVVLEKVEMYIHKTGTPESEASYLYLEVHQKRKESP